VRVYYCCCVGYIFCRTVLLLQVSTSLTEIIIRSSRKEIKDKRKFGQPTKENLIIQAKQQQNKKGERRRVMPTQRRVTNQQLRIGCLSNNERNFISTFSSSREKIQQKTHKCTRPIHLNFCNSDEMRNVH
jgi:hypothetical protein